MSQLTRKLRKQNKQCQSNIFLPLFPSQTVQRIGRFKERKEGGGTKEEKREGREEGGKERREGGGTKEEGREGEEREGEEGS